MRADWNTHEELTTLLSVGCVFDRCELSLNAQNRRKQYKMIQVLRSSNHLPVLHVKAIRDTTHIIAEKLYKKNKPVQYVSAKQPFFPKVLFLFVLRCTDQLVKALVFVLQNPLPFWGGNYFWDSFFSVVVVLLVFVFCRMVSALILPMITANKPFVILSVVSDDQELVCKL